MVFTPYPPETGNDIFHVLSDRKLTFLQIQAIQSQETSTQLGLQVTACGKPLVRGEKCRLQNHFILT